MTRRILPLLLLAFPFATAAAQHAESAVLAAADAFTRAIVEHDSSAADALLAPGSTIVEGGTVESKAEYLSHHFHSDSAFLGAVDRERLAREVHTAAGAAWVVTTTRLSGSFRDREVDAMSAELLVLKLDGDAWRVAAVHWSSRRTAE